MEQLVQVNNGVVVIAEEVIREFHEFQLLKDKMDLKEKEVKEALLKAMEENGVKKFENNFVKIAYTAPTTRTDVDRDKLKEQGLFEMFTKKTPVKASVKLTWK